MSEKNVTSNNNDKIIIEICMGTTCFVLGAGELGEIDQIIESRWPGKAEVLASKCLGLCRDGRFNGAPYVKINGVAVAKADTQLILATLEEMLTDRRKASQ